MPSDQQPLLKTLTNICIGLVWLINGAYAKLLNFVPRHSEIVARFVGNEYAPVLTKLIGISEVLMAIWIFSGRQSRLNSWLQVIIIMTMNILEFTFARDLLLWGSANIIFAILFCIVILLKEFRWSPKPIR